MLPKTSPQSPPEQARRRQPAPAATAFAMGRNGGRLLNRGLRHFQHACNVVHRMRALFRIFAEAELDHFFQLSGQARAQPR